MLYAHYTPISILCMLNAHIKATVAQPLTPYLHVILHFFCFVFKDINLKAYKYKIFLYKTSNIIAHYGAMLKLRCVKLHIDSTYYDGALLLCRVECSECSFFNLDKVLLLAFNLIFPLNHIKTLSLLTNTEMHFHRISTNCGLYIFCNIYAFSLQTMSS